MGKSPLLDQETDLISIEVSVDGSPIGDEYQVVFIEVEENINKLPFAKIEVLDGDPSKQKLETQEKKNFKPGQDIILKAGYHQKMEVIFKGIISGIGFGSKQGTHGRTTIECADKCIGLTLTKDNSYYEEKTDDAIVKEIVGTYNGITCKADKTDTQHVKMVQYNTSDWDFILTRAKVSERIVVARENELNFVKAGGNETGVTLEYGTDIINLDINVDSRNQRKSIKVKGWNANDHSFKTGTSSEPDYVDKQGSAALKGSKLADELGYKEETIYAPSTLEASELTDIANSKLLHSRLSRIKGKMIVQGFTDLKVNSFVKLTKTHENYDGDVYITGVKHSIEMGNFVTEVKIGLDTESFETDATSGSTPDNLGLLPGPKGLFIGEVTENSDDPENNFRVKVKIPSFNENDAGIWARLSGAAASENSGFIWYPEVGDQVIVGFLMNDPRFPIILGSLYSSTHGVFSDHQPASGNNQKAIVTRSHMKILFEEDTKVITITTPGDQTIVLSDEDKKIELSDQHGNIIKMDRDGILIDSSKDVVIKAQANIDMDAVRDFDANSINLNLVASAQGKFQAGPGLTLKSTGTTDLKGSMTNIKGTMMVKIN